MIHEEDIEKYSTLRFEDIAVEENKILNELEQIAYAIEIDPPPVDNCGFVDEDANYNNNFLADSLPNTQIPVFNQIEKARELNFVNIHNNLSNIGFGQSIESLIPE